MSPLLRKCMLTLASTYLSVKSRCASYRTARPARAQPRLDGVPDTRLEPCLIEAVDLLDPGRRGHVDLGEIVADDVDPDEQQALLAQRGADRGADLALARGQLALHRRAA